MLNKYSIIAFSGIIIIIVMSMISSNKAHVIGKVSWEQWVEFSGWDVDVNLKDEDSYDYDKNIVKKINKIIGSNNQFSFVLFSGSWCSDSRDAMPNIVDLIQSLEITSTQFEIIGVSLDKTEPRQYIQKYGIKYVPTLVIIHNNQEIGRLIESPKKSWEEDILEILKNYK